MECRKFEITIISASNLEKGRKFSKMNVYASVSVGDKPEMEKRTATDRHGGTNPAWNCTMKYTVSDSTVLHLNSMLVVKLYCARVLGADKYIGEVPTSMKELFDSGNANGGSATLTFPVKKGSVKSQGSLTFSYQFGEKVSFEKMKLAETVAAWNLWSCK